MDLATTAAARASALKATVAGHNAAIRQHRKARRDAIAALEDLEQECRRRGIRLVIEPQRSEGAVHGDTDS